MSSSTKIFRLAFHALLCLALIAANPAGVRAQTLTPLHSFDSYGDGANPIATLTLASDGNFYGTTSAGGAFNDGTVFRLTPGGAITTLHSFNDTDGRTPYGKLVQASNGSLYGTTVQGGVNSDGTVFKITLGGAFSPVYAFAGGADGYRPYGGLIQGTDGKLYGTTSRGGTPPAGASASGTIFRLTTAGAISTLYTFSSTSGVYTNGDTPQAGLVQATDGNLYGTTSDGGGATGVRGTVFKLTLGTTPALTTLHVFTTTAPDGGYPIYGSLIQATDGRLYGTTQGGGTDNRGAVFQITTGGSYKTIYSFVTDSSFTYTHGYTPYGGLVQASDGSLYGTTTGGGTAPTNSRAAGTIFKITTGGTITTLYSFTSSVTNSSSYPQGYSPYAGLALSASGVLYGTAYQGGATTDGTPVRDFGTVFQITTGGAFTLLDAFTNGFADGQTPYGKVIQASDGYFYGTTQSGGNYHYGCVYKSDSAGNVAILHSFSRDTNDGINPTSGVVEASDGNLYGTTPSGGTSGQGTIYRISKSGAFTTLYNFVRDTSSNYPNGLNPIGGLIQASDGFLYGTTSDGGTPPAGGSASGTLFRFSLGGTLTTLYTFGTAPSDGAMPESELFQASDGNLYGTTYRGGAIGVAIQQGTVFKLTLGTTPTLTTIHTFTGNSPDGGNPAYGSLAQASNGLLYGVTQKGGAFGTGTAFSLHLDGTGYAILSSFGGSAGEQPQGGLLYASDGNLYGTTYRAGENDKGTIFRLTQAGLLTRLYSFSPLTRNIGPTDTNPDGAYPFGGLIQAGDNLLYGVTSAGGTAGYGVLYHIDVQVPTITTVSPNSGGVGATITLTGNSFAGASSVKFRGTSAAFTVVSPTQITAVVPAGATTGRITVTAPGGTATSRTNFTVLSTPAPALTSFSPKSGAPGTLVQITGSGFTGTTGVAFGGVATSGFYINSDTEVLAIVPNGAVTGPISATGPGGTGVSLTVFTVTASNAPTITGFSPASGPVGSLVQINGTNFNSVSGVAFHGTAASYSVNSENQITAIVPAGATSGTISVTTFDGTATSANSFTVAAAAPTITGFSPASGPVGTLVSLTGTDFTGATTVKFHGTPARFTVNSATSLTAVMPGGATTGTLTVTTPGGTATSAGSFNVGSGTPAPTVTGFAPTSGPVGTSVSITGTNLTGATAVKFGGTAAAAFTVVSAASITATVPPGAATGTISVTTPGGTAASTGSFTVTTTANTTVTLTDATGTAGQTVSLTARLRRASDSAALSGETLTFKVDGVTVGTASTHSSGSATLSYTIPGTTSAGSHVLTASFAGDSSYNASSATGTLTVTGGTIVPQSLSASPNPVAVDGIATLTVTLSGPAPTGGAAVSISSGGTAFSSVTVPAGQTSVTTGVYFNAAGTYTLGAAYNGTTVTTSLVVQATSVTLASYTFNPNPVTGGQTATATVTLSAPAPAGGAYVIINYNGSAFTQVQVPQGQTTATYPQPTNTTTTATSFTFSAVYNGATKNATLNVTP